MVILVDSSVWIDFLRSKSSAHEAHLRDLLAVPDVVRVPGLVVQEVLQGIREEAMFEVVRARLCNFPIVHADTETYVMAARMYQTLARRGIAIPPGDITIAALSIQYQWPLYTLDHRHFVRIAHHSPLRLYEPPSLHSDDQ